MADPDDRKNGGGAGPQKAGPAARPDACSFEAAWNRNFEEEPGGGAPERPAGLAIPNTGRRAAPRLRVSLPAQLISIEGNQPCVLMNLSRTGAQVALIDAVRRGEGAVLRCASLEVFGEVIRSEFGLNALRFEEALSDDQVLAIRHYYETFEDRERRALIDTARKWVTGDTSDERPF
ncbi:PilZ domain-containing protein [Erythrobacter sp. HL-111]|uniref:PilZ domain-containing protein n=1 Tax=Erythrobacter sp. HL-111 TaxID=1798193 RepID=UPI0006DB1501|nr:PilZ domain-containing protein [Erythrobacter sp. HL-111]KPP88589.1 MAG: PilZ domain [Erythrobacteraceae bacterium HL-111]SDS30409.1 hypothetical protein SAMN04515621_1324 [Erythrobacter sp. HL-111]